VLASDTLARLRVLLYVLVVEKLVDEVQVLALERFFEAL
jgi:hypothetical protein